MQIAFHRRPFRRDDREHHCVAEGTVWHAHVVAQHAVLLGAQARDGRARALVEPVGAELHRDALQRVSDTLQEHPETAAIFGAYDESPADPGFISQYKNLAHSYIHQSARSAATTFWAGFGAIRREAFQAVGGFDERFRRPSVEDIDLGYRLAAAGYGLVKVKRPHGKAGGRSLADFDPASLVKRSK